MSNRVYVTAHLEDAKVEVHTHPARVSRYASGYEADIPAAVHVYFGDVNLWGRPEVVRRALINALLACATAEEAASDSESMGEVA